MLYELYILLFGISIAYAKDLFLEEKKLRKVHLCIIIVHSHHILMIHISSNLTISIRSTRLEKS